MEKINGLIDTEGTEFPAGRRTRVVVGVDSPLQAQHFVQGIVMIHPGGAVPEHDHETEETYTILSGTGEMMVDGEIQAVKENDVIYMKPFVTHGLKNTGTEEMKMMFVYAPKMVAAHWDQETKGEL